MTGRPGIPSRFIGCIQSHAYLRVAESAIADGNLSLAAFYMDEALIHWKTARAALGHVRPSDELPDEHAPAYVHPELAGTSPQSRTQLRRQRERLAALRTAERA